MTIRDMYILNRCHDRALSDMSAAAVAIAEKLVSGEKIYKADIDRYRTARLGVESTKRDMEYCIRLELDEILNA